MHRFWERPRGAEGPIKGLHSKFDSLACLPSLGQKGCPLACKALPSLKLPASHKALLHTDHFYLECRRDATEAAFTARHTLSEPCGCPSSVSLLSGRLYDWSEKLFPLSCQAHQVKLFQWDQMTWCWLQERPQRQLSGQGTDGQPEGLPIC